MSIKKESQGKYVVDMRDHNGSRISRSFKNLADAKEFEAIINREKYDKKLSNNKIIKPKQNFYNELDHFEKTKHDLRPKSIKRYAYIINQIRLFAELNEVKYLNDFTPELATIFKEELMKERIDPTGSTKRVLKAKPKTINMYLAVLKAFFKEQMVKGFIERDPTLHIKNVRCERKKPESYSSEEITNFFAQKMDICYYNAFLGLLLTGLRFAEMANLKWKDVDLINCRIHIKSSDEFQTKTANSERTIPFKQTILDLLTSIKYEDLNEYVFKSPKGNQLRERHLLKKCKHIAKKAGITSNATLHKFRHTFATLLIRNKVQIQDIKELLGHSSIIQTEIYAHHKPDDLFAEVSILDDLIQLEKKPPETAPKNP